MRRVRLNDGSLQRHVLPILLGGTDADNAKMAARNLGAVAQYEINAPLGFAGLDSDQHVSQDVVPGGILNNNRVRLEGPTVVYAGQTVVFQITNATSFGSLSLQPGNGAVDIQGDTIVYTAPAFVGEGSFTVNNHAVRFPILEPGVVTPSIEVPVNGATNLVLPLTLHSSAFAMAGIDGTHFATSWQIATDSNFANVVAQSLDDQVNLTQWTPDGLMHAMQYHCRVRYHSADGRSSDWSPASQFGTRVENTYPQTELMLLTAADKATGDNFGWSVAISADGLTAVAGAPFADTGALNDDGVAYVYVLINGAWIQQAKLVASTAKSYDNDGYSVAITADGNTVLVGSVFDHISGTKGEVYVFTRTGTTWTQQAILTGQDSVYNDYFGYKVAISKDGNTVAVGALWTAVGGVTNAGSVYVFVRNGSSWVQQAKLVASDPTAGAQFGYSMDFSDDSNTLVVAACTAIVGGLNNAGAAYVFTRSMITWTQEAKLTASDKAANDYFGTSVAINGAGTVITVGANSADTLGVADVGAVYVFTGSVSNWSQQAKLIAQDKATGDYFGCSVSLDQTGNILLVGAYKADISGLADAGAAYVFTCTNNTWAQQTKLVSAIPQAGGNFGNSVTLTDNGKLGMIGAPKTTQSGIPQAGSVSVFN